MPKRSGKRRGELQECENLTAAEISSIIHAPEVCETTGEREYENVARAKRPKMAADDPRFDILSRQIADLGQTVHSFMERISVNPQGHTSAAPQEPSTSNSGPRDHEYPRLETARRESRDSRSSGRYGDEEVEGRDLWEADSWQSSSSVVSGKQQSQFTIGEIETTLAEPSVPRAVEARIAKGVRLQHLHSPNWNNVRFAEVQKVYNAKPVFASLEVNDEIGHLSRSDSLVTQDSFCAALTQALIIQGEHLRVAVQDLAEGDPSRAQDRLEKLFGPRSEYQKVTKDITQMVCGKRASVLEQRREGVLKSLRDRTVLTALRRIPPSKEFLFEPEALASTVSKMGGIEKCFPKLRNSEPIAGPSGMKPFPRVGGVKEGIRRPAKQGNSEARQRFREARRPTTHKPTFRREGARHQGGADKRRNR